jgi:hypothetical protein
MLPHLAAGTGYRENQSLAGFTARLCQPSTADLGGSADWCGRLLDWPLVLAVLAAVLAATSRSNRSGLEFALAVCALPLVSSVSWSFHLVVLILPIALLLRQVFLGQLSRWQIRLLLLAWACFSVGPALHYLWIVHPLSNWALPLDWIRIGLTRLVGEAYLMGSLILFASVWLALRKEREASALEHSTSIAA